MHNQHDRNRGLTQKGWLDQHYFLVLLMALLALAQACAPGITLTRPFSGDLLPPILESAGPVDQRRVQFFFNEVIVLGDEEPVVEPPLSIATLEVQEKTLTVLFDEDQKLGASYTIRVSVQDKVGNTLSSLCRFSGWNPRLPQLLINEFNPRGSGNTPDSIELFIKEEGNLAGVYLHIGTETNSSAEIRFPPVEVLTGDFLVIHAKSTGSPEEKDEIESLDSSGGKLSSPTARDFWIPGSPGIPGNNGAITVYAQGGIQLLDAVLYSDRQDDPTAAQLGWTSDGYAQAEDLARTRSWITSTEEGGVPYPSQAINVSFSTATRTIARGSIPEDTDSPEDWHTVPTRGQSFGHANTDEQYVPPAKH